VFVHMFNGTEGIVGIWHTYLQVIVRIMQ
jgi:hypothetical protein